MTLNRPIPVRIVVDGHDLTMLRLREYRQRLRVVLQGNVVLDGTVAENVLCARPYAPRDEVQAVNRTAQSCQRPSAGLRTPSAPRIRTCVSIIVVATSRCPNSSCTVRMS